MKRYLPDALMVLLFVAVSFAYFAPAAFEGRVLFQHDSAASQGLNREAKDYHERTGERTRWTNALFCGMPTYQISPSYGSTDATTQAAHAYNLWLPDYVCYLFAYLLGFYILLRAFDFRWHLAALGALIWAFSTYFLIIIAAGHYWKVMALGYLPPLIAGLITAYRGRYLIGGVMTAVFTAFEIWANHVQMTYYYMFLIVMLVVAFAVESARKRAWGNFLKAAGACAIGAAIGIAANISNLYHTWDYSKETMRGRSELVKPDTKNQTSSGLDRDYITQWSYGIGETLTLLVPDAKGGASVPLAANRKAMEKADPQFESVYSQIGQYWGEQPGTSGPVYVGAFVLLLFIFGLFIVKGPLKWALLGATLLSVALSWGKNFMPLTDFFIDCVPMYAKFRTVASILVVAEFTIPLLAMLALKRIIEEPQLLTAKQWRPAVAVSLLLTAGVALLLAVAPDAVFGSYISTQEMESINQIPEEYRSPLIDNLNDVRRSILTSDSWRSLWVILAGCGLLLLYRIRKIKEGLLVGALAGLAIADLWTVNKRYLNDEMFVDKSQTAQTVVKTQADEYILQDKQPGFRVLNFAANTFNDNQTSYYFHSIGGYHPAKLRRYQEMIDAYIVPEMKPLFGAIAAHQGDLTAVGDSVAPIINMLNAKYIIVPTEEGKTLPVENPAAFGPAWIVRHLTYAANANEELDALRHLDLRHEAVADSKFKDALGASPAAAADTTAAGTVSLTAYEPNRATYDIDAAKDGIVVFSEVYYKGWTATVDGQPAELGRANYILRALRVKAGKHKVELTFRPQSVRTTETIAWAALALLLAGIVAAVVRQTKK